MAPTGANPPETSSIRGKMTDAPNFFADIVNVAVGTGSDEKAFAIHANLLTKHSEYFKAALKKDWQEGREKNMVLDEEDPDIFNVFANFLYTGKIFSIKEGDLVHPTADKEWVRLSQAWMFGERRMSVSFKDAILDASVKKCVDDMTYPTKVQADLYPASHGASTIRKWLVDVAVGKFDEEFLKGIAVDAAWAAEYLRDVAIALTKKDNAQTTIPRFLQQDCYYHEHGEGAPCYKSCFEY